ncbi:SDR family NAD(P)-dependent oxidoreductase [Streptomyces oceani]|uniref:Gluconate 5-dehydrogenase n=1 Tax=Streptomyces oceani TaxID=1075402 RepID=A0A1E7KK46_9ACTN|nr:SDR family NAD(P)-dependent oxidoreductase [Streptomyces oceani]OEV04359.1 gluconate 5-dehydrogenase [Streptomyces oceani]
MKIFDLSGRTCLVTGAAGGIGGVLALGLAEAGADVVLSDRPGSERLATLAEEIRGTGRRATVREQDLSRPEELLGFVDAVWAEVGRVDVLVNCAGVARLSRFNEVDPDDWHTTLTTNLTAPFLLSRRTAEHMIHRGVQGRIVMLSSKNGIVGEPGLVAYNASKAGLEQLTQSLALELGEHGITVNAIAPGVIETGIDADFELERSAFEAYYREHIPLRHRFGSPRELVGALLLLASDAGSYITGQSVVVDGGVLASQLPRMQFMRPYVNALEARDAEQHGADGARGAGEERS